MAIPDTRDELEKFGYQYHHSGVCRACRCELHFFITPRNKTMPMSPIPGTEDEDPQRLECHIGKCSADKSKVSG